MSTGHATPRDLLGDWRTVLAAYGLPTAAIVVSGAVPLANPARGAVWAVASAVMGAACLANASRCGRVHCYFTGPFLLAIGAAAGLYGFGVLPLGPGGWNLIGAVLGPGALLLMTVPERLFGKYARPRGRPG